MKAKELTVTAREISIDTAGLNFLCVIGTHINGGYAAIPNWGVSAELSASEWNIGYNADKLHQALISTKYGESWLPKSETARRSIAQDLSEIITPLIAEMS